MGSIPDEGIQARILPPVNFHFHILCFRRILDPELTRRSLAVLLPHITTARDLMDQLMVVSRSGSNRTAFLINIAFTYSGLLTLNREFGGYGEAAFREGLAARCEVVGTQLGNSPATTKDWKVVDGNLPVDGGRRADILLLVCGFDPALVTNKAVTACRVLAGTMPVGFNESVFAGAERGAYVERPGDELREHFGFRDAITEPLKFNAEGGLRSKAADNDWHHITSREAAELDLDRFLCGLHANTNRCDVWDSFSEWGSYLVFLRLHQDVYNFHSFCIAAAEWISGNAGQAVSPVSIAEQLVGRRLDGRPLVPCDDPELNKFLFHGNGSIDPKGLSCPRSAHIRRANPRDDTNPRDDKSEWRNDGLRESYRRMILRRGMPYGPKSPSKFEHPIRDGVDRGMHFIGLMLRACSWARGDWCGSVCRAWFDGGVDQ
jgi:deferrochelatase/peroxidase EfeB